MEKLKFDQEESFLLSDGESSINLKVEKYILKRSCLSNADFIEIQGIAGGDLGIPSAVVKLS